MGREAGHVTGHGLKPAACLKMLGNGVVPQQAELALRMILGLPATLLADAGGLLLSTPDTAPEAPNTGSNRRSHPSGLGNQVKLLAGTDA